MHIPTHAHAHNNVTIAQTSLAHSPRQHTNRPHTLTHIQTHSHMHICTHINTDICKERTCPVTYHMCAWTRTCARTDRYQTLPLLQLENGNQTTHIPTHSHRWSIRINKNIEVQRGCCDRLCNIVTKMRLAV